MKISFPFFKKKKDNPEKIFETKAMEAKDVIAPASIALFPDYLKLGKKLVKSFFIFSYPRYLSTGWFSPVINLDVPMDISFHIHPIDTGTILKQLRKRVTQMQAELEERQERGLIRDPALEIAYRDIETLRDRLQTAQERIFKLGIYLTLYENSQKELRETETNLRSILESRLIYIKPALYQQKEGQISTSPCGLDQIQVHTSMNTGPLSSIFPFVSFDLSSNEGILYGINRHNNSLVLFDRFDLENANSILFGKSGSGKSIRSTEPVLIKEGKEIKLVEIGPFVENLIKRYGASSIDKDIEGVINPPNIQVYSFDKNLKTKWSKVTVAMKKTAPQVFYRFTTESGREITTTGDHNMVILKNGKVIIAKGSQVKKGDLLPLPQKIHFPSQNTSKKPKQANDFLKLAGFVDTKGMVKKNGLKINNLSKENLKEIKSILKKLKIYNFEITDKGKSIIITEKKILLKFLNRDKESIFNLERKKMALYLSACFEANAIIKKRGKNFTIEMSSGTKDLLSKITYLLSFFGVVGTINKRKKCFSLIISNKDSLINFAKHINFISPQKRKILSRFSSLKPCNNKNIFWDKIVKIQKIKNKKDKYVYDLTVDSEIFLAGKEGIFVHNSYAIKLEILRSLMLGISVLVIDPENEYKFLSDAVGGSFFNVSLASPHHINPFDLPVPRQDEKPEDVLRSNIINLVGLMRIMLGGLTPEEDAIIDRALTETYALKDITPETPPHLWPERVPLMEDFESVLEGMEGAESLLRRVRKFTKGTFANFFNQRTNISLQKPFVVFGIRDLEDQFRPIAMFIIMRFIWNTVRSSLKKRILVIDEAWWLMQSEDGASFLYGICKRARKYWLGVTTITQDVNDFMKSMYGQPIITNSSLQLIMKQSPATIDVVQKTFNLTEQEKYLLLEAEVGEGIFFAGQKHVAIKVVASYTEDQFITTSPEQVLRIKEAKKKLNK